MHVLQAHKWNQFTILNTLICSCIALFYLLTVLNHFHLILFFNGFSANIPHLFKVFRQICKFIYVHFARIADCTYSYMYAWQLLNESQLDIFCCNSLGDLKCIQHLIESNICTDFPLWISFGLRKKNCRIFSREINSRKVAEEIMVSKDKLTGFNIWTEGYFVKEIFILGIVGTCFQPIAF